MKFRYLWMEMRLVLRNARFTIFTLATPAVLFLVYAGLWGGANRFPDGTPVSASLMVSMAAYGAMGAALSTGATIAVERGLGWQRQLRLTPLSGVGYLLSKALLAMLVALPAIALVSLLGRVVEGVHLSGAQWLTVTLGLWLAVLPFAALGVLIGQFATQDSIQPIMTALMMVLGLAGGMWIPAQVVPGWMRHVMEATPTYWLREVGQSAFSPAASLRTAILVLGGYALVAAGLAARRYVTDTARV